MKYVLISLLLWAAVPLAAQSSEDTVTIPRSQLTEQQKAELTKRSLDDKIAQYGKWVGVGHEIGVALDEGLTQLDEHANSFARTPVGEWAMAVIIFKVIGPKIVAYLFILGMFAVGMPIWIWSYRKYLPHKYLVKVNYGPDGKKASEEYDFGFGGASTSSNYRLSSDVASSWCVGHWVILALAIIIGLFAVFGGD